MNNQFKFFIDDEEIKTVRQGFVMNESLSEDLNTCDIIYKSKNKNRAIPYETPFKIIDEIENKEYNYIVAHDEVVLICQSPEIYQHTLLLVNGKKYYSRIPIPTFTLTHTPKEEWSTVLALLLLQMNYPLEIESKWDTTRLFNVPSEWLNNSKFQEKAPQLFLTNTTMSDVLDRLFKNVNYYCKVDEVYTKNKIPMLSYINPNSRNGLIKNNTKFYNTFETDPQNHATTLQTNLLNAVVDEDEPQAHVYYPGRNMWARTKIANSMKNVRNEDGNLQFIVDRPIIKLKKLNILIRLTMDIYDNGVQINPIGEWININQSVDISNYVYVKEQHNTLMQRSLWDKIFKLPREEYKDKESTLYYEYKGNIIFGGNNKVGNDSIVSDAVKKNLVNREEYVIYNGIKWYNKNIYGDTKRYTYGIRGFNIANASSGQENSGSTMVDFHYNVEYITENNVIVNQKRIDNEGFELESYVNINQSENVPNVNEAGKNVMGIINRIGLDKFKWQNRVKTLSQVPKLGEYTNDGYVITQKVVSNYNDYSEYMLILQKNFNMISQNTALEEETRPFDTPRKGITNELHYDEYMIFSKYKKMENDSFLQNSNFLSAFVDEEIKQYRPEIVVFQSFTVTPSGDSALQPVCVPLQSFSFGNSLCFNFQFTDNVLAGNRMNSITGTNEYPVKYTDEYGVFSKFTFDMFNDETILYGDKKDISNGVQWESTNQAIAKEDFN